MSSENPSTEETPSTNTTEKSKRKNRIKKNFTGKNETDFENLIKAHYYPNFILNKDDKLIINYFLDNIPWSKVEYQMYGQQRVTPRLTWCYGKLENDIVEYRGKKFKTEEIPLYLKKIIEKVKDKTGFEANAVILNNYEDGNNHINWHANDEQFLEEKTIASISLNAERIFSMRNDEYIFNIKLCDGSLLMMYNGPEHALEKSKELVGQRFNITLRKLKDERGFGNYYYYNRGIQYDIKDT